MRTLIVAAAAASLGLASASQTIPASSASVKWTGRTLVNGGSVSFSWEGVKASVNVVGATSLNMTLGTVFPDGDSRFHVLVDNAYLPVANFSVKTEPAYRNGTNYPIISGLDPTQTHNISIYYVTDPIALSWDNLPPYYHTAMGFTTDGAFGAVPAPRPRKLQIIGDSITAGNQIDKATCLPDHWGTYGNKICQRFDADCQTQAISGKGLYQNCCDANVTMSELYRRTIVGLPELLWDNSQFAPDAVLLNLGTNDFNHYQNNASWATAFTATYVQFLVNLTVVHNNPRLPIFAGAGPITHDYQPFVMQAIQEARSSYGVQAHFVNYTTVLDGCGHPGWIGHQQMYEAAVPVISQVMGWD